MIVEMVQVVFNIFMFVVGCSSKYCNVFHRPTKLAYSMALKSQVQDHNNDCLLQQLFLLIAHRVSQVETKMKLITVG